MCSAALSPWEHLPFAVRPRGLAAVLTLACSSACSVYSSDLLSTSSDVTSGGDVTAAGRSSGLAGKPNGAGGKLGVSIPGGGGEGNSADPGDGDMSEAGTSGTAPSAGGAAGNGTTVGGGTGGIAATAGGSATAGNVGTAGAAGSAGGSPTATGDLLDGFEDEDLTLEQNAGRGGVWYLFNDQTVGTTGPTPLVCSPLTGAPAELGLYAMHITATGFTGFGSGLGVDFRAGKKVYDASKFTGIRFWAKVGVGKNTKHRVQIADATTDVAGGKCNAAATAPNGEKCDDHFGFNATFTTSWAQYVVQFDQLAQLGWGYPAAAITKSALYGLQVTAKPKLDVDLWLDQIEFF